MSKDRKWEITSKFINICIALTQSTKRNSWLYQQTRGRKIAASGRSQSARPVSEICRFDGNNKFRENLKPEMPHRNGENASCFGCKTSKCVYFHSKNSSHSCCLLAGLNRLRYDRMGKKLRKYKKTTWASIWSHCPKHRSLLQSSVPGCRGNEQPPRGVVSSSSQLNRERCSSVDVTCFGPVE